MTTWRKLGLLGSLYFSQGLPFGFFVQALPVMLRRQGFSLGEIGLTSLLALPWALKFLWAPAVDRFGRRKGWIVPLQLAAVLVLALLGSRAGGASMGLLMAAVLLLNLIAATQDIATDGLAVDMLSRSERGFANGLQVAGYRVGMIAGGGVLLILHDELGESGTFLAMAALTALATLPIAFAREPRRARAAASHRTRSALLRFLGRAGAWRLLLLVVSYKAGDAFATGMLRPFLADSGLGLSEIGWLLGTVGFVAGLGGALAGGTLVNRLGRKNALLAFGLLQALTVLGCASLAIGEPSRTALTLLCAAEHFAGGMATAALFTCMMDWCSREASATDYTIQASAVVIATGAASALSGLSAQSLGYFGHFCLAGVLAFAALGVVWRFFPSAPRSPEGRPEERAEVAACA
jgi:MFS transporter, PAT family, beta-lactamase induction signal transducer AmpG